MTDDYNNDYEVGYGKPPKKAQFKPGQSGNKKGRPKGSRNTSTIFKKACEQKVAFTDSNGERKKLTKRELAMINLINGSVKDPKLALQILPYMLMFDTKEEEKEKLLECLNQDDKEIMEIFINDLKEEIKNGTNSQK
jgi:hypothetical protein